MAIRESMKSGISKMARGMAAGRNNLMESGAYIAKGALKGAAVGGAVGGAVNFARDEDVWEGVGRGGLIGAGMGAAYTGVRSAVGGKAAGIIDESTGRRPGFLNMAGVDTEGLFGRTSGVKASNPNKAKATNARNAQSAKQNVTRKTAPVDFNKVSRDFNAPMKDSHIPIRENQRRYDVAELSFRSNVISEAYRPGGAGSSGPAIDPIGLAKTNNSYNVDGFRTPTKHGNIRMGNGMNSFGSTEQAFRMDSIIAANRPGGYAKRVPDSNPIGLAQPNLSFNLNNFR